MSGSALSSSTSSAASGEVVYGGGLGGNGEPEQHVMSERVQQMAGAIYKEFERMIQRYDEDAVKELMPLVVSVLDSLDLAYLEKEEREVELELLREDNEQLVTQYEREKQLKRNAEQQSLEVQDHFEGEQKGLEDKVESLESIVRMLELKSKNASDHSTRLEEREAELKQEYAKLHERYTELLKNHMDYMERMKFVTGSEKFDMVNSMPSIPGGGFKPQSLRTPTSISNSGDFTPGLREVSDQLMERVPQAVTPSGGHPLSSELHEWQDELSPRMSDIMETTPELQDSARSMDKQRRQSGVSEASEATNLSKEIAAASGDLPADDPLGADLTVNDTFFGMGKEVENLIKENTELLETKNALNIVKNDLIAQVDELHSEHDMLKEEVRSHELVRAKLQEKNGELEEEIKKLKEELEEIKKSKDDEDDVPMAQRKRFTRVEMARVLMERNQYKEKLMELQEAVRWTEMIRASKSDPSLKRKQRGSIWDFFSGLFTSEGMSTSAGHAPTATSTHVRYSATPHAHQVIPGTDPMLRRKTADRHKAFDFLDTEHTTEKRAQERKEQYRLVRAHVKKDESGRMQAYGWSIPAMDCKQPALPVPVYCRPLNDKDPMLKIWCATGIILNGGRTKDGGYIVGGSVFYSMPPRTPEPKPVGDVQKLDQELKAQQVDYEAHAAAEWNYCSLIWICSSAHGKSRVAVIDANNPGDVLHSFTVCSSHVLTVASIPGTREDDYLLPDKEDPMKLCHEGATDAEDGCPLGQTTWVPLTPQGDGVRYNAPAGRSDVRDRKEPAQEDPAGDVTSPLSGGMTLESSLPAEVTSSEKAADVLSSVVSSGQDSLNPPSRATSSTKINIKNFPPHIQDGLAKYNGIPENSLTVSPTVWMGAQSGKIYVHSAVQNWKKCVRCIKVDDAVLSIVHYKGRVFAALANGTMLMFQRDHTGEWSMDGYHVICLGKPQHSVRSLTVVAGRVWASYRNTVHVTDPETFTVVHSMAVHPRKESQVRQLVWVGDGVWCSIRLDSTLRLYHAHTFQHLQDVDIEPYVSKMLGTSKLGFSFVRITSLLVSCQRLWIGTGNGVVMSVPLNGQSQAPSHQDRHKGILSSTEASDRSSSGGTASEAGSASSAATVPSESVVSGSSGFKGPGGVVRVYSDPTAGSEKVVPGTFVPYCTMTHAQLSFHGHKDAVKFFVSVPGVGPNTPVTGVQNADGSENKTKDSTKMTPLAGGGSKERMMVVSGGDGYIDFRIGEDDEEDDNDGAGGEAAEQTRSGASSPQTPLGAVQKRDMSHLIVWEVQGEK